MVKREESRKRICFPARALFLTGAVILYALGGSGLSWGCAWLYDACMETWGVTQGNVHLAPWWILTIVYGYPAIAALVQLIWVIALCGAGRRLAKMPSAGAAGMKKTGYGLLIGALIAVLWAGCLLLTDDLRMGRPLSMPYISGGLWGVLMGIILEAVGREWFFRGFLYRAIRRQGLAVAVCALVCGAIHGISGQGGWIYWTNVCLLSAILCRLCAKSGSIWPGIGLRVTLFVLLECVMGVSGSVYGLYEIYFVSRSWLSGGNAGPMAGLWMTALLMMLAAGMEWKGRQSLPDCR